MSIIDQIEVIDPCDVRIKTSIEDNATIIKISNENDKTLEFTISFPIIDFSHFWYSANNGDDSLPNLWTEPINISTNFSLPIFVFFDEQGNSQLTVALSETTRKVCASIGVHEESASIKMTFSFPDGIDRDVLKVYLNDCEQPFYKSVVKSRDWLYSQGKYSHLPSNSAAYKSVYSTWYSYHQALNQDSIVEQVQQFADYHIETLILDDGWQTDDNSRRYAYAGDWEIAESKFPNMVTHINNIQQNNIKYLVWITLPYVGEKSAAFSRFSDKFLYFDDYQKAGILDPRYREVRQYLVNTILNLVRKLHLNGLKIDFIDSFRSASHNINSKMDIANLDDSINVLLSDIVKVLLDYDPEFLIEFREDYIGPNMTQYCNIIRVKDCPHDYNKNRVGLTNIRLLCPSVAPHSDMITFNLKDSLESISLQFLNCLYGVIQLSVDLLKLSKEQREVIQHWMLYQDENREVIFNGNFAAWNPHLGFDVVSVGNLSKRIISCYQVNRVIELKKEWMADSIDVINATLCNDLILSGNDFIGKCFKYTSYDLRGLVVETGEIEIEEIQKIKVPACGRIEIKQI